MLRYVGYHRAVLVQQVVMRFFVLAGKGPRYGYTIVRRLVSEGLLKEDPLFPDHGGASPVVVSLTPSGWARLGLQAPQARGVPRSRRVLMYRIQMAEMLLEREADGWSLLPRKGAFDELRGWALRPYRNRLLNQEEQSLRVRLERLRAFPVPFNLLAHKDRSTLPFSDPRAHPRLILPVRTGKSYATTLSKLPDFTLFPPLHFEVVSAEPDLAAKALKHLEKQARASGYTFRTHTVPPFLTSSHPRERARSGLDRYLAAGLAGPPELAR